MSRPLKLRVRGVSVSYAVEGQARRVLAPVDFDCHEGEVLCLLGPTGCGKSTLLHVIGGFLKPTEGEVLIDGQPVTRPDPRRILVTQERGVFPWLTVEENIGFGLADRPEAWRRERVAHYLKLVGLEGSARAYPAELSGGMKQRLEVARALAVNPDMLLLDEAFSALDAITRYTLRQELLRLWTAEKKTVVLVTHDLDEALQLADRVLVLSAPPGRLQRSLDIAMPHPRDLTSPEYLQHHRQLLDELGLAHRI
ncbi:ABC transporter ATP-binding protein [Archangium primigenium]|uniref:ABC transporter ATP-binding protein n=1 Tax=[Archangium] primigenium TaxID=2792470 RepID=UPI00195B9C97|nr:ABC transporter ATP-binding protein [Archangium primigenium]MBM7118069.1 ABC transporter ATP-binding protein [Archangium primigenium]